MSRWYQQEGVSFSSAAKKSLEVPGKKVRKVKDGV